MALQSGRIFLFGGLNEREVLGDLWEWEETSQGIHWKNWSSVSAIPPRYAFQTTVVGWRWVIQGGTSWNPSLGDSDGPPFISANPDTNLDDLWTIIINASGAPVVISLAMKPPTTGSMPARSAGIAAFPRTPSGVQIGIVFGSDKNSLSSSIIALTYLACNLGWYTPNGTFETSACEPCPQGKYGLGTPNSTRCMPCPPGTFTTTTSASSSSFCNICRFTAEPVWCAAWGRRSHFSFPACFGHFLCCLASRIAA